MYLPIGLAAILGFIGVKLILEALHALPVRQRDRIVAAAPGLVELATAVRESDLEDDR